MPERTGSAEAPTIGAVRLSEWLSSNRLYCAWELMKQSKGTYTAWELARDIGCSQRTLYRWLNDESVPYPIFLNRLEQLFLDVLGKNWLERVEELEKLISKANLIKGGT